MRLIQHVIDERAKSDPEDIAYVIPRSDKDVDQGFEEISNARFANAVDRAAGWLKANVNGSAGQTLAFIASQDIRYLCFILAANKAGHKLLLLSPRNSDEAQKHLLGIVKCRFFLAGHRYEATSKRIAGLIDAQIETLVLPDVWHFLNEEKVDPVEFSALWDQVRHEPFVVFHTSGTTTGRPKPIAINHGYYALDHLLKDFPRIDGKGFGPRIYASGSRTLHGAPLFHVAGLFIALFKRLLQGGTVTLLPGDAQIEAGLIIRSLIEGKCTRLFTSPTILENLMARSDGRHVLAGLESIAFGAAPMSIEVGNALLKINNNAFNMYGSTEMNEIPVIELDDPARDWQYMQFHPWSGVTFEPVGGSENAYELVVRPIECPACEALQPVFENWPNAGEYRTGDIFIRHPVKENLWKWYSRTDDVITFETGEKLNPCGMESIISDHPKVVSAVVVGRRRMQPALLIEPVDWTVDHSALLDDLWPTIQRANAEAPAYGQLVKQLVLFSREPFKRTPKGTIQRTMTEVLLAREIEGLYKGIGLSIYENLSRIDIRTKEGARELIDSVARDILDINVQFSEESNLFDIGLNSLRASDLVRAVNVFLKKQVTNGHTPPRIDIATVYSEPTIKGLSGIIVRLANGGQHATESNSWPESAKRLLTCYTPNLAAGAAILTGSTGSLGAHFLHYLLHDEGYSHIYCLNRSETAEEIYLKSFPSDSKLLSKATFLQTSSIKEPHFGVAGGLHLYEKLLGEVCTVIHNAWPVNFLMPVEAAGPGSYLSSFEPQFDGVARILRFCAASSHKARFVYISSMSSMLGGSVKPIPEAVVTDPSAPSAGGYPRSKWITEVMLDSIARENPGKLSRPIIIRPGQISGPLEESVEIGATGVGSVWNARDAIASIFISSSAIGALPSTIGHEEKLRWVPVDIVAKSSLEIIRHVDRICPAGSVNHEGAAAYNIMNIQDGKERTWNEMTPFIQSRLEKKVGKEVPVVSMTEWVQRVQSFETGNGEENPAAKLTDFMANLAETSVDEGLGTEIDTKSTKEASKSLRELQPVQESSIGFWMQGWGL